MDATADRKETWMRYAAVHPAADLPAGYLPDGVESVWVDLDALAALHPGRQLTDEQLLSQRIPGHIVATDRVERRPTDLMSARVFEAHP
jgi:hypothetical protein